ncbi:tRNA (adenosine(37)-N6)-threonylcarbamoyltransferase complex transferase subunit TsaD [Candidatus Azambacteria bacterium RIFCSPHIGHO2_01_FULL_40_24]|uniref:tRNA N6-adenosine threonylcarbamoyltransferase n=1 Tax=Candidatus Azambacteria bacterium RIFCSPHIGHO2_01_FULL_40_24 TaxID=1797301 RepID=A0A1F5B450_9BACT|nr:MAG: tRNA (adenosine(37)-N6)-threonylcarbamoyltransferase complex transferase subunit TsaD [Candidatus Azambacteria bacterium RIFCSPHIGHO2_01_FULL_40_24]
MRILGIETSCDDTAAAVIEADGEFTNPSFLVLSNVSYSQVAIHKKFGGIVPNLASRAHLEKIAPTVKTALLVSDTNNDEIDLIAVTRGPGLLPSLLIGVNFARALSYKWEKPIIGVNHVEGHIYSNWLQPIGKISNLKFQISKKIGFPALILIVSGGHTELVLMKDYGKYKIIGETLDDAAGECFDKTARILGLGFPGGPAVAAEAAKFSISNFQFPIKLPRPIINSNNYNFSFSGLKTAVLYLYNDLIKKYPKEKIVPAIAIEIQQAIVDVLIAKTVKAIKNYNPKSVMIAGGVSANKKLREEMSKKIAPYKIPFFAPELSYTTDNASMIAAAGYFSAIGGSASGGNYSAKKPKPDSWKKLEANANLRL